MYKTRPLCCGRTPYMRMYTFKVKEQFSEIHTCECGMKFLQIQEEIDLGYNRVKCPWCEPYQHNGVTPQLKHYGIPYSDVLNQEGRIDFNNI